MSDRDDPTLPSDDWSGATCRSVLSHTSEKASPGRGSVARAAGTLAFAVGLTAGLATLGCESPDEYSRLYAPLQDGTLNANCADVDGDGYGVACSAGSDCDDGDAQVTNQCYRCATPDAGCACDRPREVVACGSVHAQIGDRVTCTVGERTCERGVWSGCRYPGGQVVQTISSPLLRAQSVATGPSGCVGNPCDPFCHEFAEEDPSPGTDGGAVVHGDGVSLEPGSGDGAGPVEACGGPPARRLGLTTRFVVQSTSSMAPAWTELEASLGAFAERSTGMIAGLDYFPTRVLDDRCDAAEYEDKNFAVPMSVFPGAADAQLAAFKASLASRAGDRGTGYSMLPALNGALSSAAQGSPEDRHIVVLIADGVGRACAKCGGTNKTVEEKNVCAAEKIRDLVAQYHQKYVNTYVIAIDTGRNDADLALLDEIALAGSGGVRGSFAVDALGPDLNADVDWVLRYIQHGSLSCKWKVASPDGVVDPTSFRAQFTADGETSNLRRFATLAACGDNEGFAFDTAAQKVELCRASCDEARADFAAELDVTYTCRGACSAGSQEAALVPVDMFAMLDRSGSMISSVKGGNKTRWDAVTDALIDYSGSKDAADNGLALSYFPFPTECYECRDGSKLAPLEHCQKGKGWWKTVTCEPSRKDIIYGNHDRYDCDWESFYDFAVNYGVPFGVLSGPGGSQANAIRDSINRLDDLQWEYDTDTYSALRTAVELADDHRQRHPDRKAIALLVTDGEPYTKCARSNETTLQMTIDEAKAAYARGIETYVIGAGPSLDRLNKIALAGSGNRQAAFLVDLDTTQILEALKAVQQVSMPCWFPIPEPERGDLDYASPTVVISKDGKNATPLSRVPLASDCGESSAWYYDDNDSPSRINLCNAACGAVRADEKARIDIEYRCLAGYADGSVVFEYDSIGTCDRGYRTVWQDWSWWAETPDTTRVNFYAQTGSRDASGAITDLSAEIPLQFTAYEARGATACAARAGICADGDTQRVGRFATPLPRPGQVNVDALLQRQRLRSGNYLRVRAELLTSDDGASAPSLNGWHLDLSCEADQ